MNIKIVFLLLFTPLAIHAHPGSPVLIFESTLKVSALSEEVFYYGFAEGDQLLFSFREVNGKELKELEISEEPGSSIFMDFKTKKIETRTFSIARTGIYKFRFTNIAITGRICQIKIQRIPANESLKNFNTSVYWRTEYDTTYTPVEERYLAKTDTVAITVTEQLAKVFAGDGKTIVDFTLPENTIAWSYYIGVGNEGRKAYETSRTDFINKASVSALKMPGYGALAALALQGINVFLEAGGDENVQYWFIPDWNNALAFKASQQFLQYKQGNIINEASQMRAPLNGKIYLGLLNDNLLEVIQVQINVVAIQVRSFWATRIMQRMDITSRKIPYLKS